LFRIPLENATKVEHVKYKICEKFVEYLLEKKISQAILARQLNLDPSIDVQVT
tara:strand:- start:2325 stop:2483 length:159 start_codon:yes stop_codon:yes gene_type:complete